MSIKPTIEEIKRLTKNAKTDVYSERDGLFLKRLSMFHGEISCAQPKGWPAHVPPTHKRLVRWAVNQIISDIPVVSVMSGRSEKSKKNADICRQLCQYLLNVWDRKSDIPPSKEATENMMIYGMGVFKGPLFDVAAWGPRPKKNDEEGWEKRDFLKHNSCAIILSAPDPLHIFPDLAGEFMIESGNKTVGSVKAQWRDWNTHKKSHQEVEWSEFWTSDWRAYIADGEPVLKGIKIDGKTYDDVIPNVLGYIPYSYKYSGWGKSSPYGKISEKCVSIYDGLESSIEAEARSVTAVTNDLRSNVYSRFILNNAWTNEAIQAMSTEPGAMVKAPDGVDLSDTIRDFPQSKVNPDLYRVVAMVQSEIERMVSSNVRPVPFAGESALHAQVGQVREKMNFAPPLRAMEEMLGEVLTKTLYLIKNVIYEPMPISGTELYIKPDNIDEPIVVDVALQTSNPEEDRELLNTGMALYQAGLISKEMFLREYLKITRYDDEMAQQLAERVLNSSPEVLQGLGIEGMKKLGMEGALKVIQEQGTQSPREIETGRTAPPARAINRMGEKAQEPPKSLVQGYTP